MNAEDNAMNSSHTSKKIKAKEEILYIPDRDLRPRDVLLGRGKPIVKYEGNIYFRNIIISTIKEYNSDVKRSHKDKVARMVLDNIANLNGRFLRKVEDPIEKGQLNIPSDVQHGWLQVTNIVALDKIKQTYRDIARDGIASSNQCVYKEQKQVNDRNIDIYPSEAAQTVSGLLRRQQHSIAPIFPHDANQNSRLSRAVLMNQKDLLDQQQRRLQQEQEHLVASLFSNQSKLAVASSAIAGRYQRPGMSNPTITPTISNNMTASLRNTALMKPHHHDSANPATTIRTATQHGIQKQLPSDHVRQLLLSQQNIQNQLNPDSAMQLSLMEGKYMQQIENMSSNSELIQELKHKQKQQYASMLELNQLIDNLDNRNGVNTATAPLSMTSIHHHETVDPITTIPSSISTTLYNDNFYNEFMLQQHLHTGSALSIIRGNHTSDLASLLLLRRHLSPNIPPIGQSLDLGSLSNISNNFRLPPQHQSLTATTNTTMLSPLLSQYYNKTTTARGTRQFTPNEKEDNDFDEDDANANDDGEQDDDDDEEDDDDNDADYTEEHEKDLNKSTKRKYQSSNIHSDKYDDKNHEMKRSGQHQQKKKKGIVEDLQGKKKKMKNI